ncbi:hypothetical protein P8852_14270, partial [Bacillus spizizenii]|nr:hypothetical protein [Bacillus spizizenii]MEC0727395.1 hypothetical protein [Bacillus spizizenii]
MACSQCISSGILYIKWSLPFATVILFSFHIKVISGKHLACPVNQNTKRAAHMSCPFFKLLGGVL